MNEMESKHRLQGVLPYEGKLMIGGEWITPASKRIFTSYNPSTKERLMDVAEGGEEDVGQAVEAALKAFPKWRDMEVNDRAKYLVQLADAIAEHKDEFAYLDAVDGGNSIKAMRGDVDTAVSYLKYFAYQAKELRGSTIPVPGMGFNYTLPEPYGVVGRIVPYNHPMQFAVAKIAAALAAGNTVVLKPAEQTPLSAIMLGELARGVLPPGVLNIVTGGAAAGSALVKHPHVYRIAFTGSYETAKKITEQAGIKVLTLELGGKNPFIVFPDVDLEEAADAAVRGMNFSWCQGQSCGSTSRLFLHKSLHEPFIEAVLKRVKNIRIGLPTDEDTEMGCLVSEEQYDKVMKYIKLGVMEGAKLIHGGQHPGSPALKNGYFIEPTVFDHVNNRMSIAQEEIFGPVLSIIEWEEEAEMIRQVNDVIYGLTANIWTKDLKTAHRMAKAVQAGYIWVNGHGRRFQGAPFGGYKSSGIGKENSFEELLSFTQIKNVNISL